jgi:hypothetical protein
MPDGRVVAWAATLPRRRRPAPGYGCGLMPLILPAHWPALPFLRLPCHLPSHPTHRRHLGPVQPSHGVDENCHFAQYG